MGNMISYVKENMNTFDVMPFVELDSLVFSWLSYLNFPNVLKKLRTWEGIELRDIYRAENFEEMLAGVKCPAETMELLCACVASPRYRNVRVMNYEQELSDEKNMQFAAITLKVGPEQYYIAYRGTDSTIIGWKEDLQLSLDEPIPSQVRAVNYLYKAAQALEGTFLLGGHSKGGNLAVYAAARAKQSVQARIERIYSHDGPGFNREEIESEGFRRIRDRISKTIPQSSLVGLFFEAECEYRIIESKGISGVVQHFPFYWQVEGAKLCEAQELADDAKIIYRAMNKWLKQNTLEEREEFIEETFGILENTGVKSFDELLANFSRYLPQIREQIRNMKPETRKFLLHTLRNLAKDSAKSVPEIFFEELEEHRNVFEHNKS